VKTLTQPKPKKPGRPKLPTGEAKGRIVPVRFTPDEIQRIAVAAKASDKTISEWIRSTLNAAIES
jgi:predicted HicB family RNase H-like nuclease